MAEDRHDLADFISRVAGERYLRVEENLGDGFVRLKVAEAERRQAKQDIRCVEDAVVEMLRNSRDASAKRIFVASWKDQDIRSIVVLDDGVGVPDDKREAIFEARVTSKLESVHLDAWGVHGRGMALYSIRENALDARVTDTGAGRGCAIRARFDTRAISERADQSTWPEPAISADGSPTLRGPHNIVRACCEFALEVQDSVKVYVGSPAEIVSCIRRICAEDAAQDRLGLSFEEESIPLVELLASTEGASSVCAIANTLGLEMSERTVHRILSGEIQAPESCLEHLVPESSRGTIKPVDIMKDRRGLRVSTKDAEEFARLMAKDFDYLAERYYLELDRDPDVRIARDRITVVFDISNLD
ncbi:MAG: ATP-binding protein [Atopobiaceae bacterium]|nr:ATP-binding protein [Atopobiaceae bacterium]